MGVTVRLQDGRPLYIHTVGMHNGTKRNASTHKYCKFDRLSKTPNGSIVIALLLRALQREHRE